MKFKINNLLSSTRWSISYIILIPLIISILMIWNASQRIAEFEQAHHQVAKSTTSIVANEISKRIKNEYRLLQKFAKTEAKLLQRLAEFPNDDDIRSVLHKKVADSFPNYFAVSLANRKGIPILDDFDGEIGSLCLEDLKSYAASKPKPMRVHPNIKHYHVDLIVPWQGMDNKKENVKNGGFLFVSFVPDFLYNLLALSSPPRHELMLINKDIKNLIEITERGTRANLKRDDYRLTEAEQQRKLYSTTVENSVWELTDFHEPVLFNEYKNNIINFNLLILIFFILGSVLMIVILLRIEKRRVAAEKTKEEMFSLFNHDLRTPLNSIFGFLEIYSESTLCERKPEKCKALASRASDNAAVMRGIIDDILDVQKMDAGEMSFDMTEIDIVTAVNDSIEMIKSHAMSQEIKLILSSDENVIYANADARRIKQALTNLLSNAIKYSPEHGTVSINIERKNTNVIISVSDNGPGIDKDFQHLVFEKFAQSKSKLTRRVGGTGLGLAIVKHIVNAHKGRVVFETDVDTGTTFKIFLPV